jgi:ATP-dependent helicase/nuclease subunit A
MEFAVPHTAPEFLNRHQIVRAGAGAGKTYTLTHKVMDIAEEIYQREKRWPRIIVTTFTRKATQELRERLMLLALEEKPHLVEFINSRSHLMVSTIHGVMDLFLKRYGANLAIDPGYSVISGVQALKLARQVLRQLILEEGGDGELLERLPFNQLTKIMRRLDATFGENPEATSFSVEDFQALFASKGLEVARELESSAFNIKEESTKENWLKITDDYLVLAALLRKATSSSSSWADARDAFASRIEAMGTAPRMTKDHPVTEMTKDDAKLARDHAKEFLKPVYDPAAWKVFAQYFETLERIGKRFAADFRRAKRERGFMEIGDLELLAMECIRQSPEAAAAFATEWDHWLIDEYQDTSPFQVQLLRELTGLAPCFVVGDPQQSIYLFRGARSEVFGQRETEILEAGGEQKLLTVNRRSEPELLLFLNDFFQKFTPPFSAMEPFLEGDRKVDPSRVVAEIFIAPRPNEDGARPPRSFGDDEDGEDLGEAEESDDLVSSDVEMKAIVAHVQMLIAKGAKPDEICVLARTNQTLTKVSDWLSLYGLPTHVHAAAGFFERRETRDALAFLKFLINPHDSFNAIEVFRSPCFKLSDQLIAAIAQVRPTSLWVGLEAPSSKTIITNPSDREALQKLAAHLESVNLVGLTGAFRNGLIESGFIDISHLHDSSGRRESNIWKLLARLESEEARPGFNPLSFVSGTVAELKLGEGSGEGDAVAAVEPDRINLMTIHASKGLEFGHVILPRMDQKPRLTSGTDYFYDSVQGKWATRVPFGDDAKLEKTLAEVAYVDRFRVQELAEHARVLYVALTRAIETVFLSWTEPLKPNSWADMVRLDLSLGEHKGESYTYVVRNEPIEPLAPVENSVEHVEPRAKWRERMEAPLQTSLSVTEILERQAGSVAASADRDVARRLKVAATGTAVHKLMEMLKYPSQEHMDLLIDRWFPNQSEKVLKAIDFVRASENPPLLSIIENGEVEWGFAMMERGLLIEGAIDLWGRAPDETVWIIDYKTGNPNNRPKAFEQMTLYSLALRKSGLLAATDKIKMAAVYPFNEDIYIEDEPSADAIRARFGL